MLPALIVAAKVLISIWLGAQSGAYGTHSALTSEKSGRDVEILMRGT